eukprot:COSAG04_NODE_30784_length_260_cov_1.285714_1_plen_61_part_01
MDFWADAAGLATAVALLTAAGMQLILEGMGRGRLPNLRRVYVAGNPLGDGGAAALAEALAD